jgi:hypothetical protein
MSESAAQALSILRDPSNFQWSTIPILVIVIYIYNVEVGKRNWNVVFAGLALWGMDWFNEIANSLIFHFTGYAPLWAAPGGSAYLILIGLNIEICLMFLVMGVATAHVLPQDKRLKILGIPNRACFAVLFAAMAVVVELFLNAAGALTWEYRWWSAGRPWLIFLFGYLTFFIVSYWVHDMPTMKQKVITVGALYGFDAACLFIFGALLGWL